MAPAHPAKVFFLGSSAFAVPSLLALVESGVRPLVITKPDQPAGRGKKNRATPIQQAAQKLKLSFFQPENLSNPKIFEMLKKEEPDLIVSIAFGDYIPQNILKLPRQGCINLHPSLLPKYRGAAPVQRALMAGEKQTGITLAYVTEVWDAGDILLQEPYPISPEDNAGALLEKLGEKGALLVRKAIPLLLEKKMNSRPQDASQATLAPKIKESETWITWEDPGSKILNLIRGLSPQPGAKTRVHQSILKIYQAKVIPGSGTPGKIVDLQSEGPAIATGENLLLLLKVQPENRNMMSGKDYVNGYRLQAGQAFQD